MVILIVDIILMAIFIAAGMKSDCGGGVFALGIFLIVVINMALSEAEDVANNPEARKRAKRQMDKDQKEWDEWRYRYR